LENLNDIIMSNESAKINLKIGQVEISIEGPPDFVSAQYDKVEAHLKTYSEMSTKIVQSDEDEGNQNNGNSSRVSDETLPETFGEWLNKIPNQTSDTQKAILAGYYVQKSSEDNSFRE
jgi:flagellar hook-basal body complex protein FliE